MRCPPRARIETKQLNELIEAVQAIVRDPKKAANLRPTRNKLGHAIRGRRFWEFCFRMHLLDADYLRRVISLSSKQDFAADLRVIDGDGEFARENCSYTAPATEDLEAVLNLRDDKRVVVICFDSRNWHNYPNQGVLCAWSDGVVDFVDAARAEREFGIKKDVFADPQAVIGKLRPFQRTFEE